MFCSLKEAASTETGAEGMSSADYALLIIKLRPHIVISEERQGLAYVRIYVCATRSPPPPTTTTTTIATHQSRSGPYPYLRGGLLLLKLSLCPPLVQSSLPYRKLEL